MRFKLDRGAIAPFCDRWNIRELALFGSALREDFGPESDVDVLVTFRDDADWSLLDMVRMQEDLSSIVGRSVDLVNRESIERSRNWIRRNAILESAVPVYAA